MGGKNTKDGTQGGHPHQHQQQQQHRGSSVTPQKQQQQKNNAAATSGSPPSSPTNEANAAGIAASGGRASVIPVHRTPSTNANGSPGPSSKSLQSHDSQATSAANASASHDASSTPVKSSGQGSSSGSPSLPECRSVLPVVAEHKVQTNTRTGDVGCYRFSFVFFVVVGLLVYLHLAASWRAWLIASKRSRRKEGSHVASFSYFRPSALRMHARGWKSCAR